MCVCAHTFWERNKERVKRPKQAKICSVKSKTGNSKSNYNWMWVCDSFPMTGNSNYYIKWTKTKWKNRTEPKISNTAKRILTSEINFHLLLATASTSLKKKKRRFYVLFKEYILPRFGFKEKKISQNIFFFNSISHVVD